MVSVSMYFQTGGIDKQTIVLKLNLQNNGKINKQNIVTTIFSHSEVNV